MARPDSLHAAFDTLKTKAKGRYPFTLACPSFVFRADYPENVQRLAPFVDEIQLLFFESRFAGSLPSPALIDRLANLGRDGGVTFNVHLPSDIFLGHCNAAERQRAADVLIDLIHRCAPLDPSTFTLHLERDSSETKASRWQARTAATLETVLTAGIDSRRISIENLNYDYALAGPIVEALDLSVCMDMGHLLAHGEGLAPFYTRWQDRISIVHLHGVDGDKDHLPLDRLSHNHKTEVIQLIDGFGGGVVIEVYSEAALEASLGWLKERVKGEG